MCWLWIESFSCKIFRSGVNIINIIRTGNNGCQADFRTSTDLLVLQRTSGDFSVQHRTSVLLKYRILLGMSYENCRKLSDLHQDLRESAVK